MGDGVAITADGPHPAEEVSRRLAAIDIFLATYSDGVSTRRGAMMAALQHGLAVVGTLGHHTDAELSAAHGEALWLVPINDPKAFDAAVVRLAEDEGARSALGRRGRQLFDRRYAWPAIARQMLAALADIPA